MSLVGCLYVYELADFDILTWKIELLELRTVDGFGKAGGAGQ